jgi:hypothetical protein
VHLNQFRRGGRSRSVLRRRALRSDGVYRILRRSGETVEVEVIKAPGLAPGTHVRLSAAAVRAMRGPRASERVGRIVAAAGRLVLGHLPIPKLPVAPQR